MISADGQQLGVITKTEALNAAREAGLDLVEVSPDADPPVARIVDWGKYNYQKTKQQQKNRTKAKPLDMKQIRFGLKIGSNDLDIKLRKASDFLEAGHKVKITVIYRGRELAHKELGYKLAERAVERLGEGIVIEQPPQFLGKQLNLIVRSTSPAKTSRPARADTT